LIRKGEARRRAEWVRLRYFAGVPRQCWRPVSRSQRAGRFISNDPRRAIKPRGDVFHRDEEGFPLRLPVLAGVLGNTGSQRQVIDEARREDTDFVPCSILHSFTSAGSGLHPNVLRRGGGDQGCCFAGTDSIYGRSGQVLPGLASPPRVRRVSGLNFKKSITCVILSRARHLEACGTSDLIRGSLASIKASYESRTPVRWARTEALN
jgi:hypothetical protein